jgi:hypothetical protein
MAKQIKRLFIIIFLAAILFLAQGVKQISASADDIFWGGYEPDVQMELGLGNNDPRNIIANIVNIILSFMGIIAITVTMMSGFKYMVASGNKDDLHKAKSMLVSGLVGLTIVLSSFAIAQFLINHLFVATDAIG